MKTALKRFLIGGLFTSIIAVAAYTATVQPEQETAPPKARLTLEVLGTGGPNDIEGRASSGYLVWLDDKARVMIEAGGGSALRFGQSGAALEDLDLIGMSHFHVDHSVDLITLAKRGYFANRDYTLLVAGPTASQHFPSTEEFIHTLFNEETGAFRYLAFCGNGLHMQGVSVDVCEHCATPLVNKEDLIVKALGVEHADVPTVAYRVDTPVGSIAFSGDQNGRVEGFIDFIQNVDILVMHFPIEERLEASKTYWHAGPSTIGKIAQAANVKKLVLTHFMECSLEDLDSNLAVVKEHYSGKVELASDLQRFEVFTC